MINALIEFGRLLRREGFKVTPSHLESALGGLLHIELGERWQFRTLLRANFASDPIEFARFDQLFGAFWSRRSEHGKGRAVTQASAPREESSHRSVPVEENGVQERSRPKGRGPDQEMRLLSLESSSDENLPVHRIRAGLEEVLASRDFASLNQTELALIQSMILKLAQTLARRLSRRYASSSRKGAVDLRATLRRSLGSGGEMLEIRRRRRRLKRAVLHLLLDISGSMDVYGRFFLVFMYGMQRRLFKTESYVFSTRLTRVSEPLKILPFRQALARIQSMDVNWSGGTDIGGSLMDFLSDTPGPGGGDRDVVILVSDGWDRGNPETLAKAMKILRRHCRILIWLNPLMASESYRPINRGARIMLPFVDYLLPFYNFASLAEIDRIIRATPPMSKLVSARGL